MLFAGFRTLAPLSHRLLFRWLGAATAAGRGLGDVASARAGERGEKLARRTLRRAARAATLAAMTVLVSVCATPAAARTRGLTIYTDQIAGPPLMGLGVQLDPYDSIQPTQDQWNLIFQRLDFMRPGFLRVVESAYDYFAGYDGQHNPKYHWNGGHVQQLLTILQYAKSRGITVVLGDWLNPMINGDPRIPGDFLKQLHDIYGYTNIKYYNLVNEPNDQTNCGFGCWTNMVRKLSTEFSSLHLTSWLRLVGPDNANDWDDTAAARALDQKSGLDTDNPIGGDSWVTKTLQTVRGQIGPYDSHRYGTIWGIEHGVYEDQMRARREQISNVDSAAKRYFVGELGMSALQQSPFHLGDIRHLFRLFAPMIDPSAHASAGTFVDSQPHIHDFAYGVWMGDEVIQDIAAGVSGASAWDLDDAMHTGGRYGSKNLKQWGFWNSLGGKDGYSASDLQLRPWYYAWSVIARSFPAGSQPLLTPSTGMSSVRVAAVKVPNGTRYGLSFAVVNDSTAARSITLSVPSARQPITLARYDYFNRHRPFGADGFPVPAQVLNGVQLSAGLTVQLPAQGLVVLSSLPTGSAVGLSEGTGRRVDGLNNWKKVAVHTKGLKLDHNTPERFNGDRSRAIARATGTQYLVYRAENITSFELKAYYQGAMGLRVYRFTGGKWTPIALQSTNPAPAWGGHGWYLTELVAGAALPQGVNRLKVRFSNRSTELAQVIIQHR